MFGDAGIRLPWRAREAVGLYPSAERLTLVHLCASETAEDEWTAVGSCVSEIGASVTDVARPDWLGEAAARISTSRI